MKIKIRNLIGGLIKKILRKFFNVSFVIGKFTYREDGLATGNNCDFLQDKLFIKSYMEGKKTGSWGKNEIR